MTFSKAAIHSKEIVSVDFHSGFHPLTYVIEQMILHIEWKVTLCVSHGIASITYMSEWKGKCYVRPHAGMLLCPLKYSPCLSLFRKSEYESNRSIRIFQ